jgi:hypothetical protein
MMTHVPELDQAPTAEESPNVKTRADASARTKVSTGVIALPFG